MFEDGAELGPLGLERIPIEWDGLIYYGRSSELYERVPHEIGYVVSKIHFSKIKKEERKKARPNLILRFLVVFLQMSIKMTSMSSGIVFPRQFDFRQLANSKKLNATTAASAAPDSGRFEEVSETIGEIPPNVAPNPFFTGVSRKPSILNSIREDPVEAPVERHLEQKDEESRRSSRSSSSSRSSRRPPVPPPANMFNGARKFQSDSDNEDSYGGYESDSRRSGGERRSRRSDDSSRRSRRSRRSDDSDSDHSRSSQPFRDQFDVQMENIKSKPMTKEEYRSRQIDVIMLLRQMKENGIPVDSSVRLEQSTSLEKLEFAYEYAQRYVIRQSTFNSFQQYMVMGTKLVEVGNTMIKAKTGKGAELDGWSESVMMNMPRFNYPLQRLATKYSGASESSPEMELAMMIGFSAFTYHMAKQASGNPQIAQGFMGMMQQTPVTNDTAAPATDPMGVPIGAPGATPVTRGTIASPLGMRPPMSANTRTAPVGRPMTIDSDSEGEYSESTEEVRI